MGNMHKSFFDNCQFAIDQGFYLEAMFMEYAAIESRLEVILGVLGLPCNKFLDDNTRKGIMISHRIACLKNIYMVGVIPGDSKFEKNYFSKLDKWIEKRNGYVHGLYKNEIKYSVRIKDAKQTAITGIKLARALYNETNRRKRDGSFFSKQELRTVPVSSF